jgi:hypothetical protein
MIANDIDEKLEYFGYSYFSSPQGGHHVSALYGHTYNKYFKTDEELEKFIEGLEAMDQWELHYATGNVDVDTETGMVTPRDGTPPFHAGTVAGGYSGPPAGPYNAPKNAANASTIFVNSVGQEVQPVPIPLVPVDPRVRRNGLFATGPGVPGAVSGTAWSRCQPFLQEFPGVDAPGQSRCPGAPTRPAGP